MLFFLLSWVGQLFAPQLAVICILLAITVVAIDAPAWLALVALAATAMYITTHFRGLCTATAANQIFDNAIDALELNASNQQRIPAPLVVKKYSGIGLRPFHFDRAGVKRIKDISYANNDERQQLDLYLPKKNTSGQLAPLLIQIHGGAWVTSSKNEQGLPLMYQMANQGWACVAMNYRLGPKHRFPAMLEDVLLAIAWAKSHAADYGIDPDYAVVTGGSAGGHLAALAALLNDQQRASLLGENATINTQPNLAVPFYGRYDFLNRHNIIPGDGLEPFLASKVMPGKIEQCPELWALASPESQVHAAAPPFFIIHGSSDTLIPVAEVRAFVSALKQSSAQAVDYLELQGAEHAFDMLNNSWSIPTLRALGRFLHAHYLQYQQNSSR